MNHLADEELVELALGGEKRAFELLVMRYQRQIFNLALSLSGDYEDAADWSQESFLQVYRSLSSFDFEKGKFFSWLYRVSHNVCVNKLVSRDGARKKKETTPVAVGQAEEQLEENNRKTVPLDSIGEVETPQAVVEAHPELSLQRSEVRSEVRRALAALPENYRIPIVLQYLEGLSYKEIAVRMGLPESTIETRLFRARKMLQGSLAHLSGKE